MKIYATCLTTNKSYSFVFNTVKEPVLVLLEYTKHHSIIHSCSIKKFVACFFIACAVCNSGWYCMNVVLLLDWISALHSIGMLYMSLSYVFLAIPG